MTKKIKETMHKDELIKQNDEETDQVKTFVFILIGVALIAVALYFLSSQYLVKDGVKKEPETKEEEISYYNVNVGTVFNRPEKEYYVMAYDPSTPKAVYYSALMNNHDSTKTKLYFLNLELDINSKYMSTTSNSKATKPSELALKDGTLILIKDGKINKYIENDEEIAKEL